jgi:hypothetical protein
MITLGLLCGMPGERDALSRAFSGYDNVQIFSGTDRLNLPKLVPSTVKRLVDMGLCGGLGPPWKVADVVCAMTLQHKAGKPTDWDSAWMRAAIHAAGMAGIVINAVPYYSDGLFDESNTVEQRATIYNRYDPKPQAMSDETRFGEALAISRFIEFGVIRSLSDDWTMTLPPAATGAIMNADGSPNIAYLAYSLGKDPTQIPSLLSLEKYYQASIDSLEAAARAVAPVLAAI